MTRTRATLLLAGMFALGLICGALGTAEKIRTEARERLRRRHAP